MNALRLSLIQTAFDPQPEVMIEKYRRMVSEAAQNGSKIVVLPELSLSPYFATVHLANWTDKEPIPENIPHGVTCKLLEEVSRDHKIFVVGSLYERGGLGFRKQKGARFNTAVLYDDAGALGAACRKQHLAKSTDLFEDEYFVPGNSDYPVYSLPDVRMAMPTGFDVWFPELSRIHALKGADLLVYPCAQSVPVTDAVPTVPVAWTMMLQSHAIANGVFVAAANRIGTENGQQFSGGSIIIAPSGEILAQGSPDTEEIVTADIDPTLIEKWRAKHPLLLLREPETYKTILGRLTFQKSEEVEA